MIAQTEISFDFIRFFEDSNLAVTGTIFLKDGALDIKKKHEH